MLMFSGSRRALRLTAGCVVAILMTHATLSAQGLNLSVPVLPSAAYADQQSREITTRLRRSSTLNGAVTVRMRDETEVQGVVVGVAATTFDLRNLRDGRVHEYALDRVAYVSSPAMSTSAKWYIVAGVVVAGAITFAWLYKNCFYAC